VKAAVSFTLEESRLWAKADVYDRAFGSANFFEKLQPIKVEPKGALGPV
jgi:hypothetical protein